MPESLSVRRRTLIERLSSTITADIWTWVSLHVPANGVPVNSDAIDGGWMHERERSSVYAAVNTPECHALSTLMAYAAREHGSPLTILSGDFPQSPQVRESHERFMAAACFGTRLLTIAPRDDLSFGLLTFNRRSGRPVFTEPDRQFVDDVITHATWVHQTESEISRHAEPLLTLTQRERQILRLSMVGHGRKQIAGLLGITMHTIADHFKSMYRKLGVRSHGELMSKFISGKLE